MKTDFLNFLPESKKEEEMSLINSSEVMTIQSIVELFENLTASRDLIAMFAWSCCAKDGWKKLRRVQRGSSFSSKKNIVFCVDRDLINVASQHKVMVDNKGDENVVSYGGMLCEPLTLYWRGDCQQIINAIEEEGYNVVCGDNNTLKIVSRKSKLAVG